MDAEDPFELRDAKDARDTLRCGPCWWSWWWLLFFRGESRSSTAAAAFSRCRLVARCSLRSRFVSIDRLID